VFLVPLLVACDGNDEPTGGTADVVGDGTDTADTTPADTVQLDTALPFEVANENRDLRNGVRARVGHVVDGDTVQIWVGSTAPRSYSIRMLGLSAPECDKDYRTTPDGNRLVCVSDDEYYGLASYEVLKEMVEDKIVTITCDVAQGQWCDTDPFDRHLAYLVLDDGSDASVEMARAGAGFSFTSFYSSKRADICRAEYQARDAGRGMWILGSLDAVLAGMHADTRGWYRSHHDSRCNEAILNGN
jgi:endonuclease YncB( thermonuclease family)